YVKDGDFLHFDQLTVDIDCNKKNLINKEKHNLLETNFELDISIIDKFSVFLGIKDSVMLVSNNDLDEIGENNKKYTKTIININSLFIVNSQIKLNLDSSKIKGDVIITDSTIA